MEKLFTKEDIAAIEKDAAYNFTTYSGAYVATGGSTERTIITISKLKDLIFVKGNEHTGWEHLRNRHAQYSFRDYWKENDKGVVKLDDPSKFHPQMMPIVDYVKIADALFTEENRNLEKNHRPDLFDVFIGSYTFKEETHKYRMILYKGSKVVHSLFPDKKTFNPKNKTKYAKGTVRISFVHPPGYNDLRIPYLNAQGLPAFSVLFRKFLPEMTERVMIVVHDKEGEDSEYHVLDFREMDGFKQFEHKDMELYQYGFLADYETFISEIDKTGAVTSMEAAKMPRSFFEQQARFPEFEVPFEVNGIKGYAAVRERHTDGYVFFDISSVGYESEPPLDIEVESPFSIMSQININENTTKWVKEGEEEEADLVTAIGTGILKVQQSDFPGLTLTLTEE